MSKQSPEKLAEALLEAKKLVPKHALYRHYKDRSHIYEIIGHTVFEEDGDILVSYRPCYGDVPFETSRRLSVFTELVEIYGVEIPRFTRVDHELVQIQQWSVHRTVDPGSEQAM